MKVLVVGGTGFIGGHLVRALRERGDEVTVATRDPLRARRSLPAEVRAFGLEPHAIVEGANGAQAVVNLAGANLAGRRWDDAYKIELLASRVETTNSVVLALGSMAERTRPRLLLNVSAVGFYGDTEERLVTEQSPPGDDFLARLCVGWELAAKQAEPAGVRVVLARLGMVLAKDGGALERMIPPFRLFAGGPIGSGKQWVSWVHVDDVVGFFLHALDDATVSGPFDVVAPEAVRMETLAEELGRVLHRPSWLPVPRLALRLVLGEVADYLVASVRALPERTLASGYGFRFPTVDAALRDLLGGRRAA